MGERQSTLEDVVITRDFWKQKTVLITGHTGFKGSWLSLWLQILGVRVIGLALRPPTKPSLFELAKVSDGMVSITGDIRDLDCVKSTFKDYRPELVIHLAAQSLVRRSYSYPIETYATNVMGTANILEAARHTKSVRSVLCITSDKCYENREWVWGYRENEPMGGFDPYSSSKGCAELVISAYQNSFYRNQTNNDQIISLASARAGNVIGGGDWAEDRLVPDIMKALIDRQETTIRNPGSIRPWQHVLEPLYGYLMLAEKMWDDPATYSSGWNFGPAEDDARPVSWIVDYLTTAWGGGDVRIAEKDNHLHEAVYLKLDCSKARNLLGYRPVLPLDTALDWILDWYRNYQDDSDMRRVTESQCLKFMDKTSL
ncbi:MAG: CDP-glucose 4,6-dehydratase [Gammaproteobacteria bacterium]